MVVVDVKKKDDTALRDDLYAKVLLDEKETNGNVDVADERDALVVYHLDEDGNEVYSSSDESDVEDVERDEEDYGDVRIPYKNIYLRGEDSSLKEYFLPGVPVRIKIIDYTFQPSSHRLNPLLYKIQVKHGRFKWILEKRYKHFLSTRRHLEVYRAALVMKRPTMSNRLEKVPKLPLRPEVSLRSAKSKQRRVRKLEKFLQAVVNIDKFRNNKNVLHFLGVSYLSFIEELGEKEKECQVLKKAGGHTFKWSLTKKINPAWHPRWLILRGDFIAYIDKENRVIRDVLLFDKKFKVTCDRAETGIKGCLMISNNIRNLVVKFVSERQASLCLGDIVKMMGSKGASDWIRAHRYDSFAPIRRNSWVKWYVDGCDYFAEVADALKKAKEEIFITDWWLSPEFILKRPADTMDWRLDVLLKERADAGVKIFVLLYKEIEMAISNNSYYTKKTLMSLNSKNIKVMRHPDHIVTSDNPVFYWGHHEKLVCIDQKVSFMGGLDICYGRWDDHSHRLTDFGSATPDFFRKTDSAIVKFSNLLLDSDAINSEYHRKELQVSSTKNCKYFVGKDYYNPFVKDIANVDEPFTDLIDRNEVPRMPWHDIACVIFGHAARDLGRHFIERWNFTKHLKCKETVEIPFLLPRFGKIPEDGYKEFDIHTEASVQVLRSACQWSAGLLSLECSIYEAYKDHIRNAKHYIYIENQFFITTKSHTVINEIGDLLVQRIMTAFNNKETFRVYVVMPLLPSFPGEIGTTEGTVTGFIEHWNLNSIKTIIRRLNANGVTDTSEYISFFGLRNFADHRGKVISEILYIHSKLMIVDDTTVIIGSANINDRSMLGSRDSELAVCVQDNVNTMPGMMNGVDMKVGCFASTLRRKLFREHLGLLNEPCYTVIDPVSDNFYKNVWRERARKNTEIYEQVFGCLPSNEVKCYADIEAYKSKERLKNSDPVEARRLLGNIEGFIVEKPLDFLKDQNLFPAADSKESLVPTKVFT